MIWYFPGESYEEAQEKAQVTAYAQLSHWPTEPRTAEEYESIRAQMMERDLKAIKERPNITSAKLVEQEIWGMEAYRIDYRFESPTTDLTFDAQNYNFFYKGLLYILDMSLSNRLDQAPEDALLYDAIRKGLIFE